jgi:hypothetical protein
MCTHILIQATFLDNIKKFQHETCGKYLKGAKGMSTDVADEQPSTVEETPSQLKSALKEGNSPSNLITMRRINCREKGVPQSFEV